ncbi:MAG: S-layer homology domain-containing protein [Clostridia bacterium]|jgi:hypothetical protein|nr:S-layer homology domain-containing protein [Clostridia bacterium]
MNKFLIVSIMIIINFSSSYAKEGEIGFFGGISEGFKLPKTITKYVTPKKADEELVYKEMIFLTGKPLKFEGNIEVKTGSVSDTSDSGTFKEEYKVTSYKRNLPEEPKIDRTIKFNTNYYKKNGQIVKDSTVDSWKETITLGDKAYVLDEDESFFQKSIFVDTTPGVSYYRGHIDYKAVYYAGDNEKVVVSVTGPIYGYDQPWSKTQTQKLKTTVVNKTGEDTFTMVANVSPSISGNKTLKYFSNEPDEISFEGNYMEVISNKGVLKYEVLTSPFKLTSKEKKGSINLDGFNQSEQLMIPKNIEYIEASFAETDIKKLYSMEILEEDPMFYNPAAVMTRASYVRLLCRAMNIEPDEVEEGEDVKVFLDVNNLHPDYGYINKAFEKNLIRGDRGRFYPTKPLTREEAITIYIRIIGLENLGLGKSNITPFADNDQISSWAKQEIYAAYRLGLIKGDLQGKIRPRDYLSNQEGAAIINRLIDYLRYNMEKNYKDNIINN